MSARLMLDGKVAVVTGAASGIGRAIARSMAARGCDIAIADINEAGLAETAGLIGDAVRVTCHRVDVADRSAVARFPDEVAAAHGVVDVVINNAGVALAGTFAQLTEAEFDWLLEINLQGVVRMTRAFLPVLERRPQAQIVNLSSLFGLIAPPGQSAYAAAKFAVRGSSEALRHELEAAGSPVGVSVVHPGGVRTGIATNARAAAAVDAVEAARQQTHFQKVLRLDADQAGEIIVRGIERRQPRILVGQDAKLVAVIERLMPVGYWHIIGRRRG